MNKVVVVFTKTDINENILMSKVERVFKNRKICRENKGELF